VQGHEAAAAAALVGRDEVLALADRRLAQTVAGRGELLFVAGEAGIGKSRLLATICSRAEDVGFAVIRAAAFADDAQASGAVLLDLVDDLRRAADQAAHTVGDAIAARLRDVTGGEGDPHRRRRLLVHDVADAFGELDRDRQLLVVLDDLHWADQLSLEVVGRLAARLSSRNMLVVGAYRSDELYTGTPMRELRARLLPQRLAEEVRLARLTIVQTATLMNALLGHVAPTQVVATIHQRSDGIPLHIEELLAATGDAGGREGWELEDVDDAAASAYVPDTLADAILRRAADLDATTRDVAAAAAVIGRSFDFDLLTTVTGRSADEVDRCLRSLQSIYLVQARHDGVTFDFRHALIRDALYGEVPLPHRRQLHEKVANAGVDRGYNNAFVSAHFDQATLGRPAYLHALLAAHEAAAVSSHREAFHLYRRALRNLPPDTSPGEHAALLAALGAEAAAIDDNEAAAEAFNAAHGLWTRAGDRLAAAEVVPALVAVGHLLGEALETRVRRVELALLTLEATPGADAVRAELLSALAAAYMLDRRLDEAIEYGEQSRALSSSTGNDEDNDVGLNTAATLGSVLLFAGNDEGWQLLADAVTKSVELYNETAAARSYRMVGSSASVLVEYDRAGKWLSEGIAYADAAELWNHRSYMAAHLAHVQWARGDWDAAQQTAERAMADGRGGITTRITAQYVLGYLAMGRGELDLAVELLGEALAAGESMGELQRISPPLWGLAEVAGIRGDHERAVTLCERGFSASGQVFDAAYLFPYLVTGTRSYLAMGDPDAAGQWIERVEVALTRRAIQGTLPAIAHARGLLQISTGDNAAAARNLATARTAWINRRRFWEGNLATLDQARSALAARRYADAAALALAVRIEAERVGAKVLLAAADEVLSEAEPARAKQPWHPLSAREYSVATLVAAGLTNRQIAVELTVSPKTVSAHVEHILAKLGAARRAEIAVWAARVADN
jgi:ATP/maltotriose-dependent transcriptional regulator MalT